MDDTNDQTLVIMNGKKSLTAAEEPQAVTMTQQMPISDYDEEAEDEEKLGKTIVQPLSDVHVLDEDEEPLPVKKSIKKTTSKKEEVEEDEGDDEENLCHSWYCWDFNHRCMLFCRTICNGYFPWR